MRGLAMPLRRHSRHGQGAGGSDRARTPEAQSGVRKATRIQAIWVKWRTGEDCFVAALLEHYFRLRETAFQNKAIVLTPDPVNTCITSCEHTAGAFV